MNFQQQPDLGQILAAGLSSLGAALNQQAQVLQQQRMMQVEMANAERNMALREKNLQLERDTLALHMEKFTAERQEQERKIRVQEAAEKRKGEAAALTAKLTQERTKAVTASAEASKTRIAMLAANTANRALLDRLKSAVDQVEVDAAKMPVGVPEAEGMTLKQIEMARDDLAAQVKTANDFAQLTGQPLNPFAAEQLDKLKAFDQAVTLRARQQNELHRQASAKLDAAQQKIYDVLKVPEVGPAPIVPNAVPMSSAGAAAPSEPGLSAAAAPAPTGIDTTIAKLRAGAPAIDETVQVLRPLIDAGQQAAFDSAMYKIQASVPADIFEAIRKALRNK